MKMKCRLSNVPVSAIGVSAGDLWKGRLHRCPACGGSPRLSWRGGDKRDKYRVESNQYWIILAHKTENK